MNAQKRESGFTAVELLITLFVAAAFLVASYQLFNLIIKDGGSTRAESRAANVAYDYLRQYSASSTTIPCTASSPLNNAPITVDGLSNATISITVTCLPDAINSLSKVEADISYNNPQQTVSYATYTSSAGASNTTDITNGLVAWWKLNGDANNSVGSPNGVITNATSTIGQTGVADTAYSFNGSSSIISTNSTFGIGSTNASISCWVYIPSVSDKGFFAHIGQYTGFGIGVGNTTTDTLGNKLVMIYEGVRWIPTSASIGTGWHHIVMVVDGSSIPTAYLDGVSVGSYASTGMTAPVSSAGSYIGAIPSTNADTFNGSIDDVRVYNRTLTQSDILAIYSAGAR
jgi:Tfp pilus assembly protein PilE